MIKGLSVIAEVSQSLSRLLNVEVDPELADINSVLLEPPSKIKITREPKLSLYLYQILQIPNLKNEHAVSSESINNQPNIFELSYLFTPFAETRKEEMIILEKVIKAFNRNPVLKSPIITSGLIKTGNSTLEVIFRNLNLEQLNNIWKYFPETVFHPSVSYSVKPIKIS